MARLSVFCLPIDLDANLRALAVGAVWKQSPKNRARFKQVGGIPPMTTIPRAR